jgi:hypothetical protein
MSSSSWFAGCDGNDTPDIVVANQSNNDITVLLNMRVS